MMTADTERTSGLSRRDFIKVAGLATAAMMVPSVLGGCTMTPNAGATSMADATQSKSSTDVLVIGGGMSGVFAAVTAMAQGLNVTLIDKGVVGRSGSTPWANGFAVLDESQDRDEWIEGVSISSDYVNNRDWLEQVLDDSEARWNDVAEWGLLDSDVRHPSLALRDKLVALGVTMIERTMVTSLLTEAEGDAKRVVGAMGFAIDSEEAVVVLAKATIIAAGAGSFKASGFPIQGLTSDGDAMAYRVGARISGKEWVDFHWTNADTPASCWRQWSGMFSSGLGRTSGVFTSGMTLDSAFQAHTGDTWTSDSGPGGTPPGGDGEGDRPSGPPPDGEGDGDRPSGPPPDSEGGDGQSGPPGTSSGEQVLGAATGLGIHKAEGVWPIDLHGASDVPGLYAAGDGLASMVCGASYAGIGISLSASAVQGVTVAEGAIAYAQQAAEPTLSEEVIAAAQETMFEPRERESGFSPAWVTQVLQNTMFPYFVLMVKEGTRLEAALSTVTFLKNHLVPMLTASDAHELRLAHETANMILNAEMKLRSSLYRTESRGTHYREDYPARNDEAWLAWVLMQMGPDGEMEMSKVLVPDAWKPDPTVDYQERYPTRFPGELEYLGLA